MQKNSLVYKNKSYINQEIKKKKKKKKIKNEY